MKRIVCTLVFLSLLSGTLLAQDMETRSFQMKHFTNLDISGIFHVTLVRSDRFEVEVETFPQVFDYLKIQVDDNTLELGTKEDGIPSVIQKAIKSKMAVNATVYVPVVKDIEMSGVTNLYTSDDFSTAEFDLDMSGVSNATLAKVTSNIMSIEMSGVAKLIMTADAEDVSLEVVGVSNAQVTFEDLDVTYADIDLSGSSSATLEGKAIRADLTVSGSATYKGTNFEVETVRAEVSGAGKAEINVVGTLEPQISGAAKVRYRAQAKLRNVNVSGAANLSSY